MDTNNKLVDFNQFVALFVIIQKKLTTRMLSPDITLDSYLELIPERATERRISIYPMVQEEEKCWKKKKTNIWKKKVLGSK